MKNMLLTLIAIVGLLPPISAQEASPIASLEGRLGADQDLHRRRGFRPG